MKYRTDHLVLNSSASARLNRPKNDDGILQGDVSSKKVIDNDNVDMMKREDLAAQRLHNTLPLSKNGRVCTR